jgi:hypothetical protein
MKSKLKKIGMIALFLVTGSQEQVIKMFGESPAPVSNEVKAQTYVPQNFWQFYYCTTPKGKVGGECASWGNCLSQQSCG